MAFDPPLGRWERRLIWLWLLTTGAAAAAMTWGVFWWWVMFILTIPFVFGAFFAPTLWLYLTPALALWLVLRRRLPVAVLAIVAAVAVIAFGVPAALNHHLAAQADAVVASDRGRSVQIGAGGGTIAWLDSNEEYCSFECLRFLITKRAQAVLLGPALHGPPEPDRNYLRLRLVPWSDDRGCPLPPGVEKLVSVRDLSLIDPDQCVSFDRAPLRSARLIFNQQRSSQQEYARLPSVAVDMRRHEAFTWRAGQPQLVMRRTDASAPKLAMPLVLWPLQGADTSTPAHWNSDGTRYRAGSRLQFDAMTMVAERLYVPAFDEPR